MLRYVSFWVNWIWTVSHDSPGPALKAYLLNGQRAGGLKKGP